MMNEDNELYMFLCIYKGTNKYNNFVLVILYDIAKLYKNNYKSFHLSGKITKRSPQFKYILKLQNFNTYRLHINET